MEIVSLVLGCSVSVALVQHIFGRILDYFLRKKEKASDRTQKQFEAEHTELVRDVRNLMAAQKVSMYDRIKFLGTSFVAAGEIDFDDRRALHKMHEAYHGLGGNGDLDILMKAVDQLRLKEEGRGR